MARRINPQACLECTCFSFFAVLIFYLTISGRYLTYVTPKMAPYLYFTAAVLLFWAVSKMPGIFRPQHKTRAAHCLVLIIPALLLLLPHSAVSATGISSYYIGGAGLSGVTGGGLSAANSNEPSAPQSDLSGAGGGIGTSDVTSGDSADGSDSADVPSDGAKTLNSAAADEQYDDSLVGHYGLELAEDGSINVSDDNFYPWLSEIFTNMKRYEGVKITVKGFVFKDPQSMTADEFVPARLLMYCCAADLSVCGIMCRYDKAFELKEEDWVTVTGVIHIGKYQGEDEPQITVTQVSPAEKPQEEYVYPW